MSPQSQGHLAMPGFAALRLPAAKVKVHTCIVPGCVILWEVAPGKPVPPVLILPGVALTALSLLPLLRDETRHAADTKAA